MKYLNKILTAMAISAGFLAVSCEDQPDAFVPTEGVPSVDFIRYADRDVVIDAAYMQEIVCIVGQNLRSINQLWFNDQQAVLNTSFMTDNTLVASVPKELPKVQTDKIYMITAAQDTVTYDFKVLLPAPQLKSMSCEYQPQGEEVTVYGNYFKEPMTIEFSNAVTVTSFKSVSMTEATFTIPDDAAPGKIKITTESGIAQSPFEYFDNRGMLFDFDDDGDAALVTNDDNCWHKRVFYTEGGIDGRYLQLGDGTSTITNESWSDGLYAFEYWCGSWDTPQNITSGRGPALFNLVDFTDYATMALKFEMFIPSSNPWMACAMQIAFQPISQVTVSGYEVAGYDKVGKPNAHAFNNEENNLGSWARAMYRPWEATGSYDTDDKWVTVTIPISDFTYNKDGGAATMKMSSADDFASLTMFVLGGGVSGSECAPIIKIDNIRAVPVK